MYVAEVSAKIANDIPKNVKKQIILFHKKGLKQFIVLPKLEYQCWQSALDWRIRKHWGLSRNFDMMALSTSKQFVSRSQSNFTAEFWKTFQFNDFCGIYMTCKSWYPKFQSQMSANVFTRRAFLWTVSCTQSLKFVKNINRK